MPATSSKLERPASDPEVRRSGIGGSDAAAICGLNPWATALDVWMEKRGLTEVGASSEAAEWGTILEPVILRQYAIREGYYVLGLDEDAVVALWDPEGTAFSVLDPEFREWVGPDIETLLETIRDPDRPWRMCHLDGLVLEYPDPDGNARVARLLEGKTSSAWRRHEWGDEGSDEIPDEYVVQCQHNIAVFEAVTGARLPVDIPVLIGGQNWRVFTVDPHDALQEELVEIEERFWNRVETGDAPPATRDERGLESLKTLYPEEEGEEIVAPPGSEFHELAMALYEARQERKAAEEDEAARKVDVQEQMGEAAKLVGENWSISWKKTKDREVTDWEGALADFRDEMQRRFEQVADGERRFPHPDEIEDAMMQAVHDNTKTKPGYRRFAPYFRKLD